uniref:Ig-like domain-containing protein n=1 Tax=Poecilia latipinna TaxID=48699 RepID=A0A3B3TP66_9TELE
LALSVGFTKNFQTEETFSFWFWFCNRAVFVLYELTLCPSCLCPGVSSDALVVTQSPDVSVQERETGNISCCFKGSAERVRITWLKNQTLIKNKTDIDQSTGFHIEQKNKCSVLIIETMTRNDSGKYICKVTVEIPVLKEVEGNGTTITVTARENRTESLTEGRWLYLQSFSRLIDKLCTFRMQSMFFTKRNLNFIRGVLCLTEKNM